jgi:hypothetical protein
MRVRWTTDAAEDLERICLERICDYIATSRPGAAQNVAATTVAASPILRHFHNCDLRVTWRERES